MRAVRENEVRIIGQEPDQLLAPLLLEIGLLERALANVIANAVRFSPAGSPPRVLAQFARPSSSERIPPSSSLMMSVWTRLVARSSSSPPETVMRWQGTA